MKPARRTRTIQPPSSNPNGAAISAIPPAASDGKAAVRHGLARAEDCYDRGSGETCREVICFLAAASIRLQLLPEQ